MNSKLVLLAGSVGYTEAWSQFWTCPKDYPEVENFDKQRFSEGTWYEVRREKGHDDWASQKCVIYDYSVDGESMLLDKLGQKKNGNPDNNKPKDQIGMKLGVSGVHFDVFRGFDLFGNKELPYLSHPGTLNPKTQHIIVDTDYDNYALVYGCLYPWAWGFPMFNVQYATLLSRHEFLEYPYVKKSKDFLKAREFNYDGWQKPGVDCGYDAALTLDEVMVKVFDHEPWWPHYDTATVSSFHIKLFKAMFTGDNKAITPIGPGDVVYGTLTGEETGGMMSWPNSEKWNPNCRINLLLQYEWDSGSCGWNCPSCPTDQAIKTPLLEQVLGADHEAMITLKGLQYSPSYPNLYVDVWWLTQDLSVSDIQYLRSIQNADVEHFCCYKEGGVRPVKNMLSGFARIIHYSEAYGMETLEEGQWKRGKQVNFGRGAYEPWTLNDGDKPGFQYYLGWYGGGQGFYGIYDSILKIWLMYRKEFKASWEGLGDGVVTNHPGVFEAGETISIYSLQNRDYQKRDSADAEDPNGPPAGTGVVAGEGKQGWFQKDEEEVLEMSDEDFWLKVDNGDYNFA